PTVTPTPVPPSFITLNEFLPAPKAMDFNGDGEANLLDEYIELYNPNSFSVGLAGWALDDRADGGSRPWKLPPDMVIPARGFLLFFRADTRIALNNEADSVRLLAPDGLEVDAFTYTDTAADTPWARVEDGVGGWTMLYPPSPGGPNIPPTPTPTPLPPPSSDQIALNEVLPAPKEKDWDGDGAASYLDEWIELAYWGDRPVAMDGWRLWRGELNVEGLPTGPFYEFPPHTILQPGSYPLIFRRESGLALPASHGVLHLARPQGDGWQVVDTFAWDRSPAYDRSFSRYPDGTGPWLRIFVTPGQPNRPFPTPAPAPPTSPPSGSNSPSGPSQPIETAYQLPIKTRLTVEGVVTVPPGVFHPRVIVIQDASAGIMVYLRRGAYPPLREGDRVQATGYLKDYHGQRELVLTSARWLVQLSAGEPMAPRFMRTGLVTDAHLARLLRVAGKVTRLDEEEFWLDDGSGPILVRRPDGASWRFQNLTPGMTLSAIGVVGRDGDGLFLQARHRQDVSPPPGVLPVTGGHLLPARAWRWPSRYLPPRGNVLSTRSQMGRRISSYGWAFTAPRASGAFADLDGLFVHSRLAERGHFTKMISMALGIPFWLLVLLALIFGAVGFLRPSERWFFLSAALFWVGSFMSMFSIWWLLLAGMTMALALGLARLLRWDDPWQLGIAALAGLLIWGIMILWFREWMWLLWPWWWFSWR
ncbi:MAG TPA: hypothetical protein EYP25_13135, partial [Anaerolineae bacterium]|nr:hypothetical protein [Anaerolineae bacterium]